MTLSAFATQPASWLGGLCLWATLSSLWSQDWRVSIFFSLHLWLVFGLFLSLQERPNSWRAFALGGAAALVIQLFSGFGQAWSQSTAGLNLPGLEWPGVLTSASQAASVVQQADGLRWLRAYGTLPHPNILGGLVFVFLTGLAALFLTRPRQNNWLVILFGLGVALLALTFSRSAWLAFAVFGGVLAARSRSFEQKRLLALLLASALGAALVLLPLRELVFTRAGGATVRTEEFSTVARTWLAQQGLDFFREHPLGGLGAGAFVIALAQRAGPGYIIEPAHNIPLLAASELGLLGLALLGGLAYVILHSAMRARRATLILFSAVLAGLLVISLFDHYLWTLAPGRVLMASMLGLWAGQVREP